VVIEQLNAGRRRAREEWEKRQALVPHAGVVCGHAAEVDGMPEGGMELRLGGLLGRACNRRSGWLAKPAAVCTTSPKVGSHGRDGGGASDW
jgi:hypothetical protein